MADIRPFSAYRPAPGMEGRIAALPYDVYNREEATAVVAGNPDSFLAIDRAEMASARRWTPMRRRCTKGRRLCCGTRSPRGNSSGRTSPATISTS